MLKQNERFYFIWCLNQHYFTYQGRFETSFTSASCDMRKAIKPTTKFYLSMPSKCKLYKNKQFSFRCSCVSSCTLLELWINYLLNYIRYHTEFSNDSLHAIITCYIASTGNHGNWSVTVSTCHYSREWESGTKEK